MTFFNADTEIERIWNQKTIPVVIRSQARGRKLLVRLPYAPDNRAWLRLGRRDDHKWLPSNKYWVLPKAWFNDFVDKTLAKFGKLYVIQPYREKEVCAPACQNAKGHECQCSCMGAHHGTGGGGGWFDVSDTFAVRWRGEEFASRLMTKK